MLKNGPDILVFPPLVSVAVPALAVLLEWVFPLGVLPAPGLHGAAIFGVVLMALAGGLAVSGTRAFRTAGTNVDPRQPALKLVRSGPYRFTRNPMYLGMVVLQIGVALTFSLDWALPGAMVVFLLLHFGVVVREERYLAQKFGPEYRELLENSRRWL